jgi:hypothetical protein
LIGVLAIAAILSTMLVFLLIYERVDRTVQILRNEWQVPISKGVKQLPGLEGRYSYSLSIVLRRPVQDLLLKFGVLRNRSFTLNYTGWDGLSKREKALSIEEVRMVVDKVGELTQAVDLEVTELESTYEWNGTSYEMLLLDFTSSVVTFAPPEAADSMNTLFAFLFDPTGNISQFYSGYSDFFLGRTAAIEDLTFGVNENTTTYATKGVQKEGYKPMTDAPGFGVMSFRDLEKDDRVFALLAVNPGRIVGREAILQIIQLRLDGETLEPIVNLLIM